MRRECESASEKIFCSAVARTPADSRVGGGEAGGEGVGEGAVAAWVGGCEGESKGKAFCWVWWLVLVSVSVVVLIVLWV